ncbi:MAG TPA: sugar phosphate isomerase/epimerase [Armatimonadetes bacterium]|nr:sugar phosphate isomerase/epimerase [Armatimonadota bacterium]
MKLGCSTILFGGYSLDEALDGIVQAGYGAIELCTIPGMAPHLELGQPEAYYAEVRAKVADRGLVIESIGASGRLNHDDPSQFVLVLEAAAALGAPAVTSGPGGKADDWESLKRVAATLNDLAPQAAELGVKISLKPHVRNAMYDTPSALRLMEMVDTRWIGLNVDASHLWRTPSHEIPEASIPKLAPYIVTARIRDTLSRDLPIGPVETQIPGGGAMNLPAIAAALKAVPGLEYVTLEIVGTKDYPKDEVQKIVEVCRERLEPLFV